MIVFDTETTGLVKPHGVPLTEQPEIIEIAVITLDDHTLEETGVYTEMVKPKRLPLDAKITEITGIVSEDLKDKRPFSAIYPTLCDVFIGQRVMVGHNVAFDRDLLYFELLRMDAHRRFPWPIHHRCTVELNQPRFGRRVRQDELYAHYFGAKPTDAHRALNDVRNLAACLRKMRDEGLF